MAAVLTASDAAEVMLRASDPHMAVVFVAVVVLGFGFWAVCCLLFWVLEREKSERKGVSRYLT